MPERGKQDAHELLAGLPLAHGGTKPKARMSRVIPARAAADRTVTRRVIGGDHAQEDGDGPAITIEKSTDDRIRRIIVQCTCGRHAELTCEYD